MSKAKQVISMMGEGKKNLNDLDYLELTDIPTTELRKYSKEELINALSFRCQELLDMEKEIAKLKGIGDD